MARKAMIVKNERRKVIAKNAKVRRQELKKQIVSLEVSEEERMVAQMKLDGMKKDGSPVRHGVRCQLTGRPRGNYRKFGLSRIAFRTLALKGQLPGVTKASW